MQRQFLSKRNLVLHPILYPNSTYYKNNNTFLYWIVDHGFFGNYKECYNWMDDFCILMPSVYGKLDTTLEKNYVGKLETKPVKHTFQPLGPIILFIIL